jgi:hypothetical protein
MKSLFGIAQEYLQLADELTENGGELTQELEQALTINREELTVKAQNYHYLMNTIEAQVSAAEIEMDRIAEYIKFKKAAHDRLKASLLQALLLFGEEDKKGIKRLEIGTLRLSTRRSESTAVESIEALPEEYKRVKTVVEADKTAIKKALQEGVEVPGCGLDVKYSLQIK